MNVFFVFDDGSLLTPPLGGTILPGITRDSILTARAGRGAYGPRGALLHRPVARRRRERAPQRILRLRHRRGGLADRRD